MLIDNPLHHYRINPNSSVSASTSKVCSVVDEWEEMLRWVLEDQKLREVFAKSEILAKVCWGGLYWNYNRLSRSSLKLVFLRRASRFFQEASDAGMLPLNHYARKNGRDILEVMKSPLDYHRQLRYGRLKNLAKYKTAKPANGSHEEALISVVVACYNTSVYIESCLTSILQQDYQNIEIICVDDCSIDDTPLLVRHFMRKDKRIQFVCTDQNSGLSASRNLGISQCHGEYVMFVDGDDCLLPGAISNLYAGMSEQDDVVVGSVTVEYEEGKDNYGTVADGDKGYFTIKNDQRFHALTDINAALNRHVSAWSKLWRMSVLKEYQIAFPVGLYYEDVSFYWKYLLMAPRVHCIKQPVYLYHRHMAGSIMGETFRKKPGMGIHNIYILEDIFKFAESHGKEDFVRKELSGLYEKYFWQAYNSSPKEDYEQVLDRTNQVLKDHQVDISKHPVLQYVSTYHDVPKSTVFMDAYQGSRTLGVETSPVTAQLSRKLKKYRLLTKIFAWLSVLLFVLLVASLLM
jgi:glycosyltransferase involved in cell wall biosynthesis